MSNYSGPTGEQHGSGGMNDVPWKDLTLKDLAGPLRALRTLAAEFPDLPAVDVQVSPIYPDSLELTLHDDLSAFETWREALGIAAETVTYHEQGFSGTTVRLEGSTEVAGATVRLRGFAPVVRPAATGDPVKAAAV
ncbi:hypothetical protein [Wenjunlia tyrosinilytica]|uniref:Uncharacterized protein n=1 Tax=Wenjunlia tyrosinilytica TaxID=1544741 RepID=A0A917N5L0_9ACTN|nr:hypothetical protein [Wenjunlia tyrosinilytica]GGI67082.1 hypothetical protein GCM10012280_72180 [Wenjunlia tyrosinilytica]